MKFWTLSFLFVCAFITSGFATEPSVVVHISNQSFQLDSGSYQIDQNSPEVRIKVNKTDRWKVAGSIFFNAQEPSQYALTFAILNSKDKNVCTGNHSFIAVDAKDLLQEIDVTCRQFEGKVKFHPGSSKNQRAISIKFYEPEQNIPSYVFVGAFRQFRLGLDLEKVNSFKGAQPNLKTAQKSSK